MIKKKLPIIIIVIGTVIVEIMILGEQGMSSNTIAILVALIALIGSIWVQIVQFKKDAQRIEDVNRTSASVKQDTVKMEPSIARIENNTDVMKDRMLENILPQIKDFDNKINRLEGGVGILVKNAEFDEKIKNKVSNAITDPTIIKNAVNLVYEENARLNNQINTLSTQNVLLQHENKQLKVQKEQLEAENRQLKMMVQKQYQEIHGYDGEEIEM